MYINAIQCWMICNDRFLSLLLFFCFLGFSGGSISLLDDKTMRATRQMCRKLIIKCNNFRHRRYFDTQFFVISSSRSTDTADRLDVEYIRLSINIDISSIHRFHWSSSLFSMLAPDFSKLNFSWPPPMISSSKP